MADVEKDTVPIEEPPPIEAQKEAETPLGVVLREGAFSPRKALTGLVGIVVIVGGAVLWLTDPRSKRQVNADTKVATASPVAEDALGQRFSLYEAVSKVKDEPRGDVRDEGARDRSETATTEEEEAESKAKEEATSTEDSAKTADVPPRDVAYFRARSMGSSFMPALARTPATSDGASHGPTVVPVRPVTVPRGTRMVGFLESTIRTDNLDSRLIVRLLEDLKLGGRVILPAGGELIGEVDTVRSRYQDRVGAHVTSYKYPDGMHEQELVGLLMDLNLAAHLPADDRIHHTKGLIWGTVGLAVAGAVSGSYGSANGENFGEIAGAGAVRGFTSLAERNLEHFTQVMPTLLVEPRPVVVWVDSTFEALPYDDIMRGQAPLALPAPSGPARPTLPGQPDMGALLARLEELRNMGMPAPPSGLPR